MNSHFEWPSALVNLKDTHYVIASRTLADVQFADFIQDLIMRSAYRGMACDRVKEYLSNSWNLWGFTEKADGQTKYLLCQRCHLTGLSRGLERYLVSRNLIAQNSCSKRDLSTWQSAQDAGSVAGGSDEHFAYTRSKSTAKLSSSAREMLQELLSKFHFGEISYEELQKECRKYVHPLPLREL
jgi:hypothetical protein